MDLQAGSIYYAGIALRGKNAVVVENKDTVDSRVNSVV